MSASDSYPYTAEPPEPPEEPAALNEAAGPVDEPAAAPSGFRAWRRSRPFWGGLFAIIGGVELVLVPLAPMPVVIHQGIAGIGSYLIGVLLAVLGLLLWFQPAQRTFYGVVAVLLSLASFVTSNFGGFVIGMLLGLIGGSLGFAWAPGAPGPKKRAARRARRGGSSVLGLAMLPALAAFPMNGAQGTAASACLISFFCPSSSPTPSPSSSPGTTSAPSTPGVGPTPTPSPNLSGKPGKPGKDAKDEKKAKGKAAKFVPKRKHLKAKPAARGQAPVSVQANTLTAATMTQYGLSFDGVVAMPTAHGHMRMLKFSADRVVMTGSDLTSGPAGRRTTTGQSELVLNGNVKLYTTKLHAKLFGIPLTFTPDFPPPLVLPKMRMTDVTSTRNFTVADRARLDDLDLRTS